MNSKHSGKHDHILSGSLMILEAVICRRKATLHLNPQTMLHCLLRRVGAIQIFNMEAATDREGEKMSGKNGAIYFSR